MQIIQGLSINQVQTGFELTGTMINPLFGHGIFLLKSEARNLLKYLEQELPVTAPLLKD